MNLEMAALISDNVVDEVIESLSNTHKTLVSISKKFTIPFICIENTLTL